MKQDDRVTVADGCDVPGNKLETVREAFPDHDFDVGIVNHTQLPLPRVKLRLDADRSLTFTALFFGGPTKIFRGLLTEFTCCFYARSLWTHWARRPHSSRRL